VTIPTSAPDPNLGEGLQLRRVGKRRPSRRAHRRHQQPHQQPIVSKRVVGHTFALPTLAAVLSLLSATLQRKNPPRSAADGFWAKQNTLNIAPWLTGPVNRGSDFLSTRGQL
jgi:hypothetical protein